MTFLAKHIKLKLTLFSVLVLFFYSCSTTDDRPVAETAEYKQAVADFYMSLGASQTDEARFAFNKMNDVAQAFPEESAAWANLGVYAMRQGNYDLAESRFERALQAEPNHPDILFLSSIMESRRGNISGAIDQLRSAAQAGPDHLRVLFSLAAELEREDDVANVEEIENTLLRLFELIPENQVVLLELARIGAKEQNEAMVQTYLDELQKQSSVWDEENRLLLNDVYQLLAEGSFSVLSLELAFLRTGLETESRFQDDLLAVQLPPTDVGFLITRFLNLPHPEVIVALPDLDMQLSKESLDVPVSSARWVKGVTLLEDLPPFPVSISDSEIVIDENERLDFPGTVNGKLPLNVFTEIDYNYNFRNDIAVAADRGFKLFEQSDDETFVDVTSRLNLQNATQNGSYSGVWALDVDMDGDLDLLLARSSGDPFVIRNNGDGTFTESDSFGGAGTIIDFRWADLDGDGVPEAIMLTTNGELKVFRNLRGGRFAQSETVAQNRAAIVVADLDANGEFDIISIGNDGILYQNFFDMRTSDWNEQSLRDTDLGMMEPGEVNLFSGDIDNNGALDLVISTDDLSLLFLGDENRQLVSFTEDLPGGITALFDVDGNERLDILGIDENGTPFFLQNEGTKNYFARSIRARASGLEGDQRINSFGIGGEMEVRSGVLYQKQLISSPIVHFGLGEYEEAQMLRIIWPNGSVQAEFAELGMGATIFNEQILKGSCPWLFSNDGEEIHFITDALWRSPLGLRINAQETAGVIQTFDRVKIPGDKLNPVNGTYDLRMTAELWETHFFDYVNLVAVDHPIGTEIFVDERFVFPAPDLSTQVMSTPAPVKSVTDEQGNDYTDLVRELDENYMKPFSKTAYQGLVEEHSIVIELDKETHNNPDWLLLSGWLRPTDSSINLALSQGSINPPTGIMVEVSDGGENWNILHDNFGVPAGKLKTILLDLTKADNSSDINKVRLTTTSEIYWDGIFQAEKVGADSITETNLKATKQELRYRGFSEWNRADAVSPKLPVYEEISSTAQRWRDLEGFHTRFGDVTELLAEIDDRYVIMNAGDEMVLHFEPLGLPKEGYTRSYVFESDGWVKDGDYNTEASATVLPLPYHGQSDYEYTVGDRLFSDPIFKMHRNDWLNYHTRYITSHTFRSALIFDENGVAP